MSWEACFLLWRTCCWKAQWHMCHRRWGAVNNPDWDWVLVTESMVDGWNVYFTRFFLWLYASQIEATATVPEVKAWQDNK